MLLQNKYYSVVTFTATDALNATCHLALHPDSEVYDGHFPGHPVCPGVCSIEMVRECAEMLLGRKLYVRSIRQCRFTAVASPAICPQLDVTLSLKPGSDGCSFSVIAGIADAERSYMEFKGELAASL